MPTTYAIPNSRTVFDATLLTGDGTTPRTITNADLGTTGFQPDLIWQKARSATWAHVLFDSVRGFGNTKGLYSNLTDVEGANMNGYVSAANSNGYSVTAGTSGNQYSNENATTYVGWQWQAGQGTNLTNTTGTITSTVSANTTAGFSIVTYTGNNTNGASIGHGLSTTPAFFIIKSRSSAQSWGVYHQSLSSPNNSYLLLNTTDALASFSGIWTPSSSTITFPTATTVTNGSTLTYVAYCWTPIAGFSQFGSYTGNGSADGVFVYTGFRPQFIMVKASSTTGEFEIRDAARNPYNTTTSARLWASSTAAELNDFPMDILSNGFKLRNSGGNSNGSGVTYIYMAFAENPFKYANAR